MHLRLLAATAWLVFANALANAAMMLNGTVLPQAKARSYVTIDHRSSHG